VLLETMQLLRDLGISTAPRAQELLLQQPAANDARSAPPQARPMH
jgi:hypothetical protein